MSEPIRRRRRLRRTDSDNIINSDNIIKEIISPVSEQTQSTELESKNIDSEQLSSSKFVPVKDYNRLDSIRSELEEDSSYVDFTESDYSDDTHNWEDSSQSISDEYWHFLGRYE